MKKYSLLRRKRIAFHLHSHRQRTSLGVWHYEVPKRVKEEVPKRVKEGELNQVSFSSLISQLLSIFVRASSLVYWWTTRALAPARNGGHLARLKFGRCPVSLLIRYRESAKVWQRRDAQGL